MMGSCNTGARLGPMFPVAALFCDMVTRTLKTETGCRPFFFGHQPHTG